MRRERRSRAPIPWDLRGAAAAALRLPAPAAERALGAAAGAAPLARALGLAAPGPAAFCRGLRAADFAARGAAAAAALPRGGPCLFPLLMEGRATGTARARRALCALRGAGGRESAASARTSSMAGAGVPVASGPEAAGAGVPEAWGAAAAASGASSEEATAAAAAEGARCGSASVRGALRRQRQQEGKGAQRGQRQRGALAIHTRHLALTPAGCLCALQPGWAGDLPPWPRDAQPASARGLLPRGAA